MDILPEEIDKCQFFTEKIMDILPEEIDKCRFLPESILVYIINNPDYRGAIPCVVHIVPPVGELKRINISIDAALLATIDYVAKKLGKNRSEFLAESARQMLV